MMFSKGNGRQKFELDTRLPSDDPDIRHSPADLDWHSLPQHSALWVSPGGMSTKSGICLRKGGLAPSHEALSFHLNHTKTLSQEHGTASLFVQHVGANDQETSRFLVAQYEDGVLSLYCRPPWREGKAILVGADEDN